MILSNDEIYVKRKKFGIGIYMYDYEKGMIILMRRYYVFCYFDFKVNLMYI